MEDEKIQPFDSFSAAYRVLVWAGYYKMMKPKNKFQWIFHQIYRCIAVVLLMGYNISHIIFIIQRRDNLDDVFDCSLIVIPQLNLIVKVLTFNLRTSRIDKINEIINDPIFAAYNKKDEESLLEKKKKMHFLNHFVNLSVCVSGTFWPISHFVRRYSDKTSVVPLAVPFETDSWTGYTFSVIIETFPLLWVGFGHVALDCAIVTYYAHAQVQLKIIKYNLEHLFDPEDTTDCGGDSDYRQYKDIDNEDLKNRFVHYVRRFDTLVWYKEEIDNIFNASVSFHLFGYTAVLCAMTYRLSFTAVISVQFFFLSVLFSIFITQVFVYCYFGNMVQYESDSLSSSVYLSHWVSVSPQFRRMLLIASCRWSRSLTPTVAGIVPLSLDTFVSICRSAYSMYALLRTTNQ